MGFMKPDVPTSAVPASQAVAQADSVMRPIAPPEGGGKKPRKSGTPSFLGQETTPSMGQQGGKTLLGQ